MKLIKSGPAFPLLSHGVAKSGGRGDSNVHFSSFESANSKCSVYCSFHFFIFCIVSYPPTPTFLSQSASPQKIKINFLACGAFGIRAEFSPCSRFRLLPYCFCIGCRSTVHAVYIKKNQTTKKQKRNNKWGQRVLNASRQCCCTGELIGFLLIVCVDVFVCVHASVFHLTIHPGLGSICLSDHLMWV